jgi:hypothetical protein
MCSVNDQKKLLQKTYGFTLLLRPLSSMCRPCEVSVRAVGPSCGSQVLLLRSLVQLLAASSNALAVHDALGTVASEAPLYA